MEEKCLLECRNEFVALVFGDELLVQRWIPCMVVTIRIAEKRRHLVVLQALVELLGA